MRKPHLHQRVCWPQPTKYVIFNEANIVLSEFASEYPFFLYAFNFYLHHLSVIPFDNYIWLQFADLGNSGSIFTAPLIWKWKIIDWNTRFSIFYASPLLAAIFQFESPDLVKAFANHGYDLDEKWQQNPDARTALNICCSQADSTNMEAMATLLLDLGAGPNDPGEKVTATCLQHCLALGAKDLYEKLLRHPKIHINTRNRSGRTILHSLVQNGDRRALANLFSNSDVDINMQDALGYTPLHLATMLRKLDVLKFLLEAYGIRLDLTDKQGRTPLTLATFWDFKDAAVVLIDHSQAFPTPERDQLSSLVCAAKHGDLVLTTTLLEKYRYTNLNYHMDLSGKSVLHHAAANNWSEVLEKCLMRHDDSTNINQIDHSGGTALHSAAVFGNTASCQVLLRYGASVRLQDRNGRTAAHAAADAGFKDTLMCLLQNDDVDVNQRDHQGRNLM
jgi:ankyrin repeat protein